MLQSLYANFDTIKILSLPIRMAKGHIKLYQFDH